MPYRQLLLVCIVYLATPWTAVVRADEPPGTATAAEGQRIVRLIRQLGSDDYEQRESATKALARLGVPALATLRRATATDRDAEVRRRGADLVERIENSLDQLLIDYRAFGLPLPPDKASLVRIEVEAGCVIGFSKKDGKIVLAKIHSIYQLGFLVESPKNDEWTPILYGAETQFFKAKLVGPALDPQRLSAKDMEATQFESSQALALALQMHARGWKASAQTVFEKGFHGKDDHSPRTALRLLAWSYWNERLLDDSADHWPAACRQLKALLADEPALDTADHRSLVKSLALALVPSKAKPGSVESLIDDLINVRDPSCYCLDERFVNLLDLGFEAVPALLEHLDDDRLTRCRLAARCCYKNYTEPAYHYRVGDMANALLQWIAGDPFAASWPRDGKERAAAKRFANAWWDEARKQSEEAYLLAHVLPPVRKDEPPKDEWPDSTHVRLLAKKYPKRLLPLYRDILENRPRLQSGSLAEALSSGSLSREEKVELFVRAAGNKSLGHRYVALDELKKLDAERFLTLLVTTLENLPRTPAVHYSKCPEKRFVYLVCTTDDSRAWRALEQAARRADVGLRMELLENTDYPKSTPVQRRRLAFLAAFLDDDTVRDSSANKEMFAGCHAGFTFHRLQVQNLAAMRIAKILELPEDSTPEWTAEQWSKQRDRMRAAVKQELTKSAKE